MVDEPQTAPQPRKGASRLLSWFVGTLWPLVKVWGPGLGLSLFWSPATTRTWRTRLGSRAERMAARHLKRSGLKILARNFTVPGVGELDLLAREGNTLVVVEVRSRRAEDPQVPLDSVGREKRKRILKATSWLVRRYGLSRVPIRQDIVALAWPSGKSQGEIVHIRDAFRPEN